MNKGVACPYNSLNRIGVNQDPDIQSRENKLETSNKKKNEEYWSLERVSWFSYLYFEFCYSFIMLSQTTSLYP